MDETPATGHDNGPDPVDSSPDRPLVTFALFAYNQQDYIREAIEGAFAQTYQPLEIILSDDCSTDSTFAIMQEMASAYQGPHRVILRRSIENLGLANHINEVANLVRGEVIVMAAGDDISLPERALCLVEEFLKREKVHAVFSDYTPFPAGVNTRSYGDINPAITMVEIICAGGGVQIGATYAYRKICFTWPEALPHWLSSEDRLLPFRAALLGEVRFVPKKLVKYRVGNSSGRVGARHGRIHGYNHPLHLELLDKEVSEARSGRKIRALQAVLYSALIRLQNARLRLERGTSVQRVFSKLAFTVLRAVRKISTSISRESQGNH